MQSEDGRNENGRNENARDEQQENQQETDCPQEHPQGMQEQDYEDSENEIVIPESERIPNTPNVE